MNRAPMYVARRRAVAAVAAVAVSGVLWIAAGFPWPFHVARPPVSGCVLDVDAAGQLWRSPACDLDGVRP